METLPLDERRRQFEVGVFAQIAMIQALLPLLLAARGRIINVGSAGGKVAMPSFGAYSGATFAMEAVIVRAAGIGPDQWRQIRPRSPISPGGSTDARG